MFFSSFEVVVVVVLLLSLCFLVCIDGYDVIVYTATASGIAAAITSARTSSSLSIAIIEPTEYIGGMVSAGGIGLRDTRFYDVRKSTLFTVVQSICLYCL